MICSHKDALPIAINLGTGDNKMQEHPKNGHIDRTGVSPCQLRQVTRILQISFKVNVCVGEQAILKHGYNSDGSA